MSSSPRVLFVAAEVSPLVKTGGLGDVIGSLPPALRKSGHDARLLLPAYRAVLPQLEAVREVAKLAVGLADQEEVRLLESRLPGHDLPIFLLDAPRHFDRPGGPFGEGGQDWPDNAARFACLARVAARIACGEAGLEWQPDVVHAHDWHTGLVCPLLSQSETAPPSVFTIHNLAYQGLFPQGTFEALGLPSEWWSIDGVEYWGQLSLLKAGIRYADWVTTVSPSYSREICTPRKGCGLEGLLRQRRDRMVGILNGIDHHQWDPACDPHLPAHYSAEDLSEKLTAKTALQASLGLQISPQRPLLAFVGRLVEQKGIDLLITVLPELLTDAELGLQVVVLGEGEARFRHSLEAFARSYPGQFAFLSSYSEASAHRVLAGSDMLAMPSRFEPCGLVQLHALRYGAVPVVSRTGGLADTIVGADPFSLSAGEATGFQLLVPTAKALGLALRRAVDVYRDAKAWRRLVYQGMTRDFGWGRSASRYAQLYELAILNHRFVKQ